MNLCEVKPKLITVKLALRGHLWEEDNQATSPIIDYHATSPIMDNHATSPIFINVTV